MPKPKHILRIDDIDSPKAGDKVLVKVMRGGNKNPFTEAWGTVTHTPRYDRLSVSVLGNEGVIFVVYDDGHAERKWPY